MSNLEALSHAINAEHASSIREEKEIFKGKGHSSPKPQKIQIPEISAPAPKKEEKNTLSQKEVEKINKEKEKRDQEKLKAELIGKITQYAENQNLGGFFPESLKERSKGISHKDSFEAVQGVYDEFVGCLKRNHKKMFVDMMFDQIFCPASEAALVHFAKMPHKQGIGSFLSLNKEKLLQPEMDELLIELSDSYVPGPWARMASKMAAVFMNYDQQMMQNFMAQMQHQQQQEEKSNNEKEEREREGTPVPDGREDRAQKRFPQKVLHKRSK